MSIIPVFDSPTVARRSVLGAAMGLSALPVFGAANAAQENFDFSNPQDNLRAYIKLTGSLKSRESYSGWYSGMVFGLTRDDVPRPLFRVEGFGLGWSERQANGTYRQAWKEIGLYRDSATGKVLERWHNPYTDEEVEPLHIQNERVNTTMGPSFNTMFSLPPGYRVEHANYAHPEDPAAPFVLNWESVGDMTTVWLDVRGLVPNPLDPAIWVRESTGGKITVAEFFSYTARTAELLDSARSSVANTGAWNRIAPWLPWMLMGRQEGQLFYRCSRAKVGSVKQLPRELLTYAERNFPSFLEPPTEWKLPNESSWEVYQRKRKPAPVRQGG